MNVDNRIVSYFTSSLKKKVGTSIKKKEKYVKVVANTDLLKKAEIINENGIRASKYNAKYRKINSLSLNLNRL